MVKVVRFVVMVLGHGDCRICGGYHYASSGGSGGGQCAVCKGTGSITTSTPCQHGLYSTHNYCSHGYTSQHD